MIYEDLKGGLFSVKIDVKTVVDVYCNYQINLLSASDLAQDDVVKVAFIASGCNPGILSNVNPKQLKDVVLTSLYYFFIEPGTVPTKQKEKGEPLTIGRLYELGGLVGLDPGPFTFWQLVALLKGTQKRDWGTTSAVLSLVHNVNCTKKSQIKDASYFNPTIDKIQEQKRKAENAPCIDSFLRGKNG